MNPVRIEGADIALGAPAQWNADEHGRFATLWVRRICGRNERPRPKIKPALEKRK